MHRSQSAKGLKKIFIGEKMGLSTKLKIAIGKKALNESRPTKEKTKNARRQANEAKKVLHMHKKENPLHHQKVVVKKN